jgi:hypothetical protein
VAPFQFVGEASPPESVQAKHKRTKRRKTGKRRKRRSPVATLIA